ncbi:serine protein kinase RIO [Aeromicrobium sp. 9AM]|uniref:serine protein kinase RIO n=1 Tax=Aeromicrobium sp. 9AM TaxID=2653126 RepID=UPI0012F3C4BC|nr:RIO1 family regulatory kinase/ATPase [Aeromicrobium sp. 9AM]VXC40108.1 RIO kinase 1 [Aeromicrobium sp. 9AM]
MSHDDSFAPFYVPVTEPGDDERWSTWPATMPTERGPHPHPDWLVTSAAAIDTELGVVKTGKEADVHLIRRAVPDDPTQSVLLAAKRYRGPGTSDFHRSADYQEGRRVQNTRDARAVSKGSRYGRAVSASLWAYAEFESLCRMYELGAAVPYPVQVQGTEILMEFIGHDSVAAARLAQVRASRATLADYFDQVVEIMRTFSRAGNVHGDLSPYNLLVHADRVVVIDLPQLVDIVSNPHAMSLLERDCRNVCAWFTRRGVERDEGTLFAELIAEVF